MALILMDGLDKYGATNSASANVIALLTAGEWTSATGNPTIVAPLSATGFALSTTNNSNILRTLSGNFSRLIGGIRFSSNLVNPTGIQFQDSGTNQAAITINTSGTLSVKNGAMATGTVIATSSVSISANTTHYLEWDISFSSTGLFTIFLDGLAIIGGASGIAGSGDTTATANNSANAVGIAAFSTGVIIVDDFYLLDTTGPAPLNAPLLTSPRIETQFPVSDGAVQFAVGAAVIGNTAQRTVGNNTPTANNLRLRPVTPSAACTITAVNLLAGATGYASVNLRPVVYASSGGLPGTLLGSGSTVVGTIANTVKQMPLTSGVALSAGTLYFIGYQNDIAMNSGLANLSSATDDLINVSTSFAGGAPSTAPGMAANQSTVIYGTVTTSANWPSVSQNPAQGSLSFVYSPTVSAEDLYNFPPLSVVPSAIYATAVKANTAKSDAGAKTVSVRQKSASVDSSGTGGIQAPGTSFTWLPSLYPLDPNGTIAWTKATLDAAQAGVRVES